MEKEFHLSNSSDQSLTNMDKIYSISQVAENSLLVKYHQPFSTHLSVYIARCSEAVARHFANKVLNTIPSYDALLITFQPYITGDFTGELAEVLAKISYTEDIASGEVISIPTYYSHEVAEFMDEILEDTGYSLNELIQEHTAKPFFVYMIGFCPGFGYMGELPKQMQLPRRKVPQLKIPAGSVAIADFQTAIYPIEMPGGWHIIGRTPLKVFDAKRKKPSLFKQGDLVQFRSISREEYRELEGEIP